MSGFLASILDGAPSRRSADMFGDLWSLLIGGGIESKSGVAVTADEALRCSTVLACVRVLAEGIAQVPFRLYQPKQGGRGSELAKGHPVYRLLAHRPNPWQTPFEWRETMMIHAVLTGNGISFKNRVNGVVRELIPLVPGQVAVEQQPDYTLTYRITFASGEYLVLGSEDVVHIRGPSWNSYVGMDAIRLAREAIGLAVALEETHARLHKNGARPGGILTTDGGARLHKDQIDQIREAWQQVQGGLSNSWKTAILAGGLKWTQMSMTGVETEHLSTRRFQIEEICRDLKVFPQMVGHSEKTATYASAEAFFQAHVTYSLQPWAERVEQACDRDLLSEQEVVDGLYCAHTFNGLLRGNAESRAKYYGAGIKDGWLTRNEARIEEDLDPLEGLDVPLAPLNMGPGTNEPDPKTSEEDADAK